MQPTVLLILCLLGATNAYVLLAYGYSYSNNLGIGAVDNIFTTPLPVLHKSVFNDDILSIVNGQEHTLVLTKTNKIYGIGKCSYSALGACAGVTNFTLVVDGNVFGKNITSIGAGSRVSYFTTADGIMYAFGSEFPVYETLGNGGTTSVTTTPLPIVDKYGQLNGRQITAIATGISSFMLMNTNDSAVYAMGANWACQFGGFGCSNGVPSVNFDNAPRRVLDLGLFAGQTIAQIVAGGTHAMARSSNGTVFFWGENAFGALGNNKTTGNTQNPSVSPQLAGKKIVHISAGNYQSFMIDDAGKGYAFGDGGMYSAALCFNSTGMPGNAVTNLTKFDSMFDSLYIVNVYAQGGPTHVLTSDGRLFACGVGTFFGKSEDWMIVDLTTLYPYGDVAGVFGTSNGGSAFILYENRSTTATPTVTTMPPTSTIAPTTTIALTTTVAPTTTVIPTTTTAPTTTVMPTTTSMPTTQVDTTTSVPTPVPTTIIPTTTSTPTTVAPTTTVPTSSTIIPTTTTTTTIAPSVAPATSVPTSAPKSFSSGGTLTSSQSGNVTGIPKPQTNESVVIYSSASATSIVSVTLQNTTVIPKNAIVQQASVTFKVTYVTQTVVIAVILTDEFGEQAGNVTTTITTVGTISVDISALYAQILAQYHQNFIIRAIRGNILKVSLGIVTTDVAVNLDPTSVTSTLVYAEQVTTVPPAASTLPTSTKQTLSIANSAQLSLLVASVLLLSF
jgi:hypothetical protein